MGWFWFRLFFGACLLLNGVSSLASQPPKLAELDTSFEIIGDPKLILSEHCRTDFPSSSEYCTLPSGKLGIIRWPKAWGPLLEGFISEAHRRAYYETTDEKDFFHGHLILRGPENFYLNPSEIFNNLSVVLFHSAEFNHRWQRESEQQIPLEQRTPRSFVGWPDSRLQAAIELLAKDLPRGNYNRTGTIYADQLVNSVSGLSAHQFSSLGHAQNLYVNLCKDGACNQCRFSENEQLYLLAKKDGPFRFPDGSNFEAYFRCYIGGDGSGQIISRQDAQKLIGGQNPN